MRYTLRQLEVFVATARYENISRAADTLAMSQSAASEALRELERQFGIQLFERTGRRLQLNELGRTVRPRAEALLERAAELEQVLAQHHEPGPIKVGATLTIGNYLAVGTMARYMAEQPGARVTLEVANTASIVQRVAGFELDLGLIEGERYNPDLEMMPWRDDELVVFCAPSHPLPGGQYWKMRIWSVLPGFYGNRGRGHGRRSSGPCMACCLSSPSVSNSSIPRRSSAQWKQGWESAASLA